jgi:hypothetical protein
MSCSVLRVRFARGDMHMLLGVVWLVWCGILSALYLGERGAGSMLRVVRRLGSSTVPGRRADLRAPKCGTTKPRCGPARPVRHPQRGGEKGSGIVRSPLRQILVGEEKEREENERGEYTPAQRVSYTPAQRVSCIRIP